MKAQVKRFSIIGLLVLALVMVLALVPVSGLTAFAAGGTENVDFAIKESWGVYFEQTGLNRKYPIVLTNENKLSTPLPTLYRTDSDDYVFDGWYIADTDTKVTQDTVFDGYTVVVDRWTYNEKDNNTVNEFNNKIRTELAYMPYAPITFVSAKTGQRIDGLYDLILSVYEQSHLRVTTGALNDVLGEAMMRVQPPTDKGRRLKIFYMTQTQVAPPTFVLFCNMSELFHFSYQRYIENCLRETYGFKGTPIKMIIKQKGDDPEINVRGKRDKKDDQENEDDGWGE